MGLWAWVPKRKGRVGGIRVRVRGSGYWYWALGIGHWVYGIRRVGTRVLDSGKGVLGVGAWVPKHKGCLLC